MPRVLFKNIINPLTALVVLAGFSYNSKAQIADTLAIATEDTLSAPARVENEIESGGENREFDVRRNATILYGTPESPAWFTYIDMRLEAYKITVFGSDSLIAEGEKVTADPDSFPDGYRYIGLPVLNREGEEPLTGFRMKYNLNTKKGAIEDGRTKFEGGFYAGKNFTRLSEEYLQIRDGYYTTCDLDEPHFHFRSSRMKMKIKDKIVAKPVRFYIEDIPLLWLPFGMFPVRGGRTSGFILPSYGQSQIEGRYLRGMGYYFAPNDYMDAKVQMDYFDKSGIFVRGDMQYSVRYKMRGSLSGSITRKNFANEKRRRWDLRVSHSQTIDPTMSLTVSGNFQSDNSFYKDFSLDRDQRAQRRIFSSARLSKKWENSPNSMTFQANRSEDLEIGNVRELLPSITFSRNTPTYLFRRNGGSPGRTSGRNEPFYSTFNFTYSSELKNNRSKTWDDTDSLFVRDTKSGMKHNLNFSSPQKVLKYLSMNPSLKYTEIWVNETTKKYLDEENDLVTEKEKGFFTRRTFSAGMSANTKVYGAFNTNIGKLKTVRHVISPTVTFSYAPDFSKLRYGYYDTYEDSLGNDVSYDRFTGSMYGVTPVSKSKMLNFSLNNLFQARTMNGEEENKFDFFNVSNSISYNMEAPETAPKFTNLSTRFKIMKPFSLTFSTSHSLYKYNPDGPPIFLYDKKVPFNKRRFLRLTSFSTTTSFSFSGKGAGGEEKEEPDPFDEETIDEEIMKTDPQSRFNQENRLANQEIPWELRTSFSFRYSALNPNTPSKDFSAITDFNIQVTKSWRVGYKSTYDLNTMEITYQDFSIYRDMHCWELSFNWTPPNSSRSGFFLEIRVKDPKLRDIKVRKTDYGGSAIGFIK